MSPGVLANLWMEEELRTRELEERMKELLKNRGVCLCVIFNSINDLILIIHGTYI